MRENLAELFELVGYSIVTAGSARQTVMSEYSARILLGTFDRAASALELSRRFGIPIAACYRRIKELGGLGLGYCQVELPSRNGRGSSCAAPASSPCASLSKTGTCGRASRLDRRACSPRPRARSWSRS
ncbi:MAG: hypothetical protein ACREDF_09405 [Thermoplasmata archaeon]